MKRNKRKAKVYTKKAFYHMLLLNKKYNHTKRPPNMLYSNHTYNKLIIYNIYLSKFKTFIHYYLLLLYLMTPWSFLVLLYFSIYKQFILVSVIAAEIIAYIALTNEKQ